MKQLADNHNSLVNSTLYDGSGPMPLYEQITPPNVMQKITSESLIDEAQIATLSDTHIYNNKQDDHSNLFNIHNNESYGIRATC